MIKANELRIGNWVYYLGTTTQLLSGAQIDKNYNDLKPIPLTCEILEEFGLKFDEYGHDGDRYIYKCELPDYNINISITDKVLVWANYEEVEHIKYLHQLQNLFFALVGEELTVNHKALSPLH